MDNESFQEWMVGRALYRFVGGRPTPNERIDWLFDAFVRTPGGRAVLKDLCGFDTSAPDLRLVCETSLKPEDRGPISEEVFKKAYWGTRPDLRFWASGGAQQLIIELKSRGANDKLDSGQAQRYFNYLADRQASGAVVYLVPEGAEGWLGLLSGRTGSEIIRFGVIEWSDDFLRPMCSQLIEVISESLVSSANFLRRALALRPR
jgi:hypothetical protein